MDDLGAPVNDRLGGVFPAGHFGLFVGAGGRGLVADAGVGVIPGHALSGRRGFQRVIHAPPVKFVHILADAAAQITAQQGADRHGRQLAGAAADLAADIGARAGADQGTDVLLARVAGR